MIIKIARFQMSMTSFWGVPVVADNWDDGLRRGLLLLPFAEPADIHSVYISQFLTKCELLHMLSTAYVEVYKCTDSRIPDETIAEYSSMFRVIGELS